MAKQETPAVAEETEAPSAEERGEIEREKTFPCAALGGSFTFRLPYAMEDLAILRRRAEILGVPEGLAGGEAMGLAHARALYDACLVHKPHKFDVEKLEVWEWDPFLDLMGEVRDWHNTFRQRVPGSKA